MTYRLASDVTWRCWDDGCVVFSAATAQTLLLSSEYGPALAAVAEASVTHPSGMAIEGASARVPGADQALVERLFELGILESVL